MTERRNGKRWKAAAAVVLFAALFLLAFAQLSEILREKNGAGGVDRIRSFYTIPRNTLDVLVLGSSHAYYGFQPGVLWDEYGISSHVMGSNKQSVEVSYYMLKEALQYQKPKVVLFETYLVGSGVPFVDEGSMRQAVDSLRMGKNKLELIDALLPNLSWKDKVSYYVPFLLYHGRWSRLSDYDFEKQYFLHGANMDGGLKEMVNQGVDFEPADMPERSRTYLDKMISLCRENGIAFAAFATPFNTLGDTYNYRQAVNQGLQQYFGEQEIPFFFFQKDYVDLFDFSADFRDETHVNYYGQKKITQVIGAYLHGEMGLSDNRSDPSYGAWVRDGELYQAKLAATELEKAENG